MQSRSLRVPLLLALLLATLVWLATSEQPSPRPTIGSQRSIALRHRRRTRPTPPAPSPTPAERPAPTLPVLPNQVAAEPPSADEKDGSLQSPLRAIREGLGQEVAAGTITPPPKILRYSDQLFLRYDADANGELKFEEWSLMHGTPELADSNHDGRITRAELLERMAAYGLPRAMRLKPLLPTDEGPAADLAAAAGETAPGTAAEGETTAPTTSATRPPVRPFFVDPTRLPQGLSNWFVDNDADGDGQISLAEFSATLSEAEVARFRARDADGDGLITPQEFLRAEQSTPEKPPTRANATGATPTDSASAADQATAPSGSGGDLP